MNKKKEIYRREQYVSQFKKPYEEKTTSEKILVSCLYNIECLRNLDRRYFGVAEAVLIMEGYLDPGQPFDYKEVKRPGLFWGHNIQKEDYYSLIIRTVRELLQERGVI